MATEEAKKENALRLTSLCLEVLASEVWDTLGDSSMALANGMGDAVLEMIEKEQGLEIAGEDIADIEKEMDRIAAVEYGFAQEISIENTPDGANEKVKGCTNTYFCDKLIKAGVKTPFICPMMLSGSALLRRLGIKDRIQIERWQDGKGCIIHYRHI